MLSTGYGLGGRIDSAGFLGRDSDSWVLPKDVKFDMAVVSISKSSSDFVFSQ